MEHVFAPGIAQILLALGFLGGLAVGLIAGASRLLGWSDNRTKGIATQSIKSFLESDELKELVATLGRAMIATHQADCQAAHANLASEQKLLEARDSERKSEIERVRDSLSQLNKNVLELATLIARLSKAELHQ